MPIHNFHLKEVIFQAVDHFGSKDQSLKPEDFWSFPLDEILDLLFSTPKEKNFQIN